MNALNYTLPLAIAVLGLFSLVKDWDAHKNLIRRVSVLTLLVIVAVLSIANTYASNKRNADERKAAAQRDDSNQKAIEQLNKELTEANEKLEFQKGQLSAIAAMLKSNSTDPAVLAAVISQVLHPPEKVPCLKPVPFTATKRQVGTGGYETVIDVYNKDGFKAGTDFEVFFNGTVTWMSLADKDKSIGVSEGAGGNIGEVRISKDALKGRNLQFLAQSPFGPLDVKCVDRFEPTQQH